MHIKDYHVRNIFTMYTIRTMHVCLLANYQKTISSQYLRNLSVSFQPIDTLIRLSD